MRFPSSDLVFCSSFSFQDSSGNYITRDNGGVFALGVVLGLCLDQVLIFDMMVVLQPPLLQAGVPSDEVSDGTWRTFQWMVLATAGADAALGSKTHPKSRLAVATFPATVWEGCGLLAAVNFLPGPEIQQTKPSDNQLSRFHNQHPPTATISSSFIAISPTSR